jgi:hypothetical protein
MHITIHTIGGILLGITALCLPAWAADSTLPVEVAAFIKQRDVCERFLSESEQADPNDIERQKYLDKNLIQYCTGSDAELRRLKRLYASDARIMQRLSGYETDIEPAE